MEGGRGGEPRRLHFLYFLSRDGKVEQPHLIRVMCRRRLLHRDGIRLRDVKRWLSELRGAGMPDAFAWASQRKYKRGYVWEDLADDDIISPVAGDEYILKGSLITNIPPAARPTPSPSATFSSLAAAIDPPGGPKPAPTPETSSAEDPDRDDGDVWPPPRVDEDDGGEEEDEEEDVDKQRRRCPSSPLRPDASAQTSAVSPVDPPQAGDMAGEPPPLPVPDSVVIAEEAQRRSEVEERKDGHARCNNAGCGGGHGGHASQVFRSLLGCGADTVRTHDSAMLPVTTRRTVCSNGHGRGGGGVLPRGRHQRPREPTEEGEARGSREGGRRSRAGGAAAESRKKTASLEVYRPPAGPHCSQCGGVFRPERLHSHMESCRALKDQRKSMSSGKLPQKEGSQRIMLSEAAPSRFLPSN